MYIADFYGWLWIIGTIIGCISVYLQSKKYYKKNPKKHVPKKIKPYARRSTPIVNLPLL
jgi:hypothetical protein